MERKYRLMISDYEEDEKEILEILLRKYFRFNFDNRRVKERMTWSWILFSEKKALRIKRELEENRLPVHFEPPLPEEETMESFVISIEQITQTKEKALREAALELGILEDNVDFFVDQAKKGEAVIRNQSREKAERWVEVFGRFGLVFLVEPPLEGELSEEQPEEERSETWQSIVKPTLVTISALLVVVAAIGLAIVGTREQSVSEFLKDWKKIVESGDVKAYEKICSDKFREDFYEDYEESRRMTARYKISVNLEYIGIERQVDEKHCEIKRIPVFVSGLLRSHFDDIDLYISQTDKRWWIDRLDTEHYYPLEEVEDKTEEVKPKEKVQEKQEVQEPEKPKEKQKEPEGLVKSLEEPKKESKLQKLEIKPRVKEAPVEKKMKKLKFKPKP